MPSAMSPTDYLTLGYRIPDGPHHRQRIYQSLSVRSTSTRGSGSARWSWDPSECSSIDTFSSASPPKPAPIDASAPALSPTGPESPVRERTRMPYRGKPTSILSGAPASSPTGPESPVRERTRMPYTGKPTSIPSSAPASSPTGLESPVRERTRAPYGPQPPSILSRGHTNPPSPDLPRAAPRDPQRNVRFAKYETWYHLPAGGETCAVNKSDRPRSQRSPSPARSKASGDPTPAKPSRGRSHRATSSDRSKAPRAPTPANPSRRSRHPSVTVIHLDPEITHRHSHQPSTPSVPIPNSAHHRSRFASPEARPRRPATHLRDGSPTPIPSALARPSGGDASLPYRVRLDTPASSLQPRSSVPASRHRPLQSPAHVVYSRNPRRTAPILHQDSRAPPPPPAPTPPPQDSYASLAQTHRAEVVREKQRAGGAGQRSLRGHGIAVEGGGAGGSAAESGLFLKTWSG